MHSKLLIPLITSASLTSPDTPVAQDRLGDPLPEGALQRLGTTRMRCDLSDLCYLPDGRGVFATGGSVEIWNLAEGKLQTKHQVSRSNIVSVVARRDGKALLLADTSGEIYEWDVERKENQHSWSTKQSGLCRAHYSPDEKRVLTTASNPATLKEWELASGKELILITGKMHSFSEGIYGPEGKTALVNGSAGSGPILAHYDLASGELLHEWLKDYYAHARSLGLSADGKRLLVGSRHKATEWLWDGHKLFKEYTGHHGHAVVSIAYCKDPNEILTGSRDGSIRRWHRTEGKVLLRWCPHASHVTHMAVSPDGKWVLSYGNHMVAETNLETGEPRLQWDRHDEGVQAVAFRPDGQHVVSGSSDGTLRIWNTKSGECLRTITGANLGAYAVAVSPDGSIIGAGCKDGVVREFNPNDGSLLRELKGHLGYIRALAYTNDGKRLLSCADDGAIRIWGHEEIEPVLLLQGHQGGVLAVAVAPDSTHLLSGGRDGTVRLWNLKEAKLLKTMKGHRSWVEAVAVCNNGKHALSTGDDSRLLRWSLDTGEIVSEMPHKRRDYEKDGLLKTVNLALACSADGTKAYSAGENGVSFSSQHLISDENKCGIACWDITSGKLLKELKGHGRSVRALALSPDGKTLVTASEDTSLLVWGVPE